MNAAAKIGDDALQGSRGGAVVPESFTHGTSAQRQRWFAHRPEDRQRQGLRHLQQPQPVAGRGSRGPRLRRLHALSQACQRAKCDNTGFR